MFARFTAVAFNDHGVSHAAPRIRDLSLELVETEQQAAGLRNQLTAICRSFALKRGRFRAGDKVTIKRYGKAPVKAFVNEVQVEYIPTGGFIEVRYLTQTAGGENQPLAIDKYDLTGGRIQTDGTINSRS